MSNVLIEKNKIDILANDISDKSGVPVTMTLDEPFTPSTYYGYDINNISADHVIVVTGGGETSKIYVKINGIWKEATPYKKVNGSWVLQTDVTAVFDSTKKYIKGN